MYDLAYENANAGQCGKCRGMGIYSWGGTVNGKPRYSGKCFSCRGTGKQDRAQIRNNEVYNRHKIRRIFAAGG